MPDIPHTAPTPPGVRLLESLGSPCIAHILLSIFLSCAVIGTIIPQGLEAEAYISAFPYAHVVLLGANLNDVFHAPWFLATLLLLALNLASAHCARCYRLSHPVFHALEPRSSQSWPAGCKSVAASIGQGYPEGKGVATLRATLTENKWTIVAEHGAKVQHQETERVLAQETPSAHNKVDTHVIVAERCGFAKFGTVCFGFGLSFVCLGLFLSNVPGLSFERSLALCPGQASRIYTTATGESNPSTELTLTSFSISGASSTQPSDYCSKVVITSHDRPPLLAAISVNAPLTARGVTFYQNSYCLKGFTLRRTDSQGKALEVDIPTNAQGQLESPLPLVTVPGAGTAFLVHAFYANARLEGDTLRPLPGPPLHPVALLLERRVAPGEDTSFRRLGWLATDHPLTTSDGAKLQLIRPILQSVICYKRDCGFPVVATGFILLAVGLLLNYGLSYAQVVAVCQSDALELNYRLWSETPAYPSPGAAHIVDTLAQALSHSIQHHEQTGERE